MMTEELARDVMDNFTRIAENEGRVFESGYEQGEEEGYNNGFDDGYVDGYAWGTEEGIVEGKKQGAKEEYDRFWDGFQNYGNRTDYTYGFMNWGSEYIRPKYKIVPKTSVYNMFYNLPNIRKVEAKYFDFSNVPYDTSMSYQFASCTLLEEIEDIGLMPCSSLDYFGAWCYALKKVACIRLNADTGVEGLLYGCPELEDVTIEGVIGKSGINLYQNKKLNRSSITSFINALSNTISGLTITFSLTAVNNAFGSTSAQEWLDLIQPKREAGWTIALV